MSVAAIETSEYVTTVIESVIRMAERGAALVGTYLQSFGATSKSARNRQPTTVPAEITFGFAAILQIWQWERAGLRPYLTVVELPTAREALQAFWQQDRDEQSQYLTSKAGSRLLKQVIGAFLTHCALAAPEELGVDLVVVGTLDESLLEEFADFVWQHRHLMREEN